MSLYLVTGGTWFIGSNLVSALVAAGHQVRVLDNFSTGHLTNLLPFQSHIELISGDLRHYATVQQAVQGVDFILHQAALASVSASVQDPLTSHEVNLTGTLHLLYAAREAGVKRLVMASSSAVYGDNPELPKHEEMTPEPLTPYAITKLAAEQYCQAFWRLYGFETVCLRYFNVFGPNQDPNSQYAAVIPRFITALLQGERVIIYGDGQQSRDFIYVEDVVQANLLACTAPGVAGGIFNIAWGKRYTLLEVLAGVAQIIDCQPEVQYEAARAGDIPHSQADITQARLRLGFEPQPDFATSLALTIQGYGKYRQRIQGYTMP